MVEGMKAGVVFGFGLGFGVGGIARPPELPSRAHTGAVRSQYGQPDATNTMTRTAVR